MECLRCGANLKDNAVVCKKCGFIVKGAKKVENTEPPVSFEETIENASAEELRAMLLALKAKRDAAAQPKNEKQLPPEKLAARSGKRWATASFICGLLSLLLIVIPGVNVIAALILFVFAFMGFGKSNGYRTNLAMVGLILTIVAIAGSWVYNAYAAPAVGEMLGLTPQVAETAGEVTTAA